MASEYNSDGNLVRFITVKTLQGLLDELEDSDVLSVNAVGNLSILRDNREKIGYIDIFSETIEWGLPELPTLGISVSDTIATKDIPK